MMRSTVISEPDMRASRCDRFAFMFNRCHPSHDSLRILDDDFIERRVIAKIDLEASPGSRDTWIEMEIRLAQTKTQNPFDARSVHPSRRTGVPRPTTAADVRRLGINIGGNNIRLDFVSGNVCAGVCMIDRVQ